MGMLGLNWDEDSGLVKMVTVKDAERRASKTRDPTEPAA